MVPKVQFPTPCLVGSFKASRLLEDEGNYTYW